MSNGLYYLIDIPVENVDPRLLAAPVFIKNTGSKSQIHSLLSSHNFHSLLSNHDMSVTTNNASVNSDLYT